MPELTPSATVSRETYAKLTAFAQLLATWNPTVNLVAPSSLPHLWSRHIDESLSLIPFLNSSDRAVDLGSGAGFPGLVLSIALGIDYVLVESDHRKASFLREAIRLTAAPAKVHIGRVEEFRSDMFDVVTARAFAPLPRLISVSRHLLDQGSRYVLLKSGDIAAEIEDARRLHRFSAMSHPSTVDSRSAVVEIHLTPGQPE